MLEKTSSPKASTDFPGLIFAYRFVDGQAEAVPAGSVATALSEPGGWIWIHLALADPRARDWIAREHRYLDHNQQLKFSICDCQSPTLLGIIGTLWLQAGPFLRYLGLKGSRRTMPKVPPIHIARYP